MQEYLVLFFMASILSYLATPLARRAARSIGAVVPTNEATGVAGSIPAFGGFAVYLAFAGSFLVGRFFLNPLRFMSWSQSTGLILAGTLMFVVGILDDRHTLSPLVKFFGQLAAATLLICFGIRLEFVPLYLSFPLTILYLVAISNAVNFIDGMDGLASGVSGIAGLFFFILFLKNGRPVEAVLGLIVAGSVLGFLRYNLFKPNSIFLGDCGSLVLGSLLAGLVILATPKTFEPVGILVPIIILGIPVLDLVLAILRRLRARKDIFSGDRNHPYDLLLRKGYSQKRTAFLFYLIGLVFGGTALIVNGLSLLPALGLICAVALLLWGMARKAKLSLFAVR